MDRTVKKNPSNEAGSSLLRCALPGSFRYRNSSASSSGRYTGGLRRSVPYRPLTSSGTAIGYLCGSRHTARYDGKSPNCPQCLLLTKIAFARLRPGELAAIAVCTNVLQEPRPLRPTVAGCFSQTDVRPATRSEEHT